QKKLIMLPSETMIWQPEFTDKTLSRKPGAVHYDALRVISAVDRGTSSSSQTLPQSEQVSQPAASSNFSSLWGD
ncbi:hypothetical protein, partial [Escherichia coli]